jgi:hypothetical protein
MLGRNMTFFVFTNLKIGAKIQQFWHICKKKIEIVEIAHLFIKKV